MDLVLTLREYEKARIGDRWDPEARQVSESVVSQLEKIQSTRGEQIFSIGRREIAARHYVGTLGLGDRAIDVLPKVDESDDPTVRRHLIQMLATAGLVPALEAGEAQLGSSASAILDVFMALYVRRLAVEWRRGPIRDYRKEDRQRRFLRGKLLFHEQIRRNLQRPENLFTRADEFNQDTPLSRLLKAGLLACAGNAVGDSTRHAARELISEFDGIGDASHPLSETNRIVTDRRTERFRSLAELAKLLLAGKSPDGPGGTPTHSLVFDMNVVFERYIGNLLRRTVCPPERRAELQLRGAHLLMQDRRPQFALRPDVGIYQAGALACVIDTKWKRLDPALPRCGVSTADVYQMYAYGKEYACPIVVLLYPRHGELPARVASYRHLPGGTESFRIEVCTVDVSHRAKTPPSAQLSELLADLSIP
jgi:5-methylcytosine-specific restriction enzyme subunit McrC